MQATTVEKKPQSFDKRKVKTMKILQLIKNCEECPHRRYYSGSRYECTNANEEFPEPRVGEPAQTKIPSWCPLPDYPSRANIDLEEKVRDLQGELAAKETG